MTEAISPRKRLFIALGVGVVLVTLGTLLAPLSPEMHSYARGLTFAVAAGAVIMSVAIFVAIPLGVLAGSGPRSFDALLRFVCDFVGALPTLFVSAVLWAWASRALGYVCALGVLRGLELAWLLRCEIVRLEAEDHDGAGRGLGRTPLFVFLRRRLPAALGPLFVSASFSIAWLVALDSATTFAGLRPSGALPTWGLLLGGHRAFDLPALLAAGSVALLTVALHALFKPPAAAEPAADFGTGFQDPPAP